MDRPIIFSAPMVRALLDGRKTMTRRMAWIRRPHSLDTRRPSPWQKVKPGDRLWVRENWALLLTPDGEIPVEPRTVLYAATDQWEGITCPSIHLRRADSRLTLVVTAAKVERLQRIDGIEALAEGITRVEGLAPWRVFMRLWDSIHGEGAWKDNPEVVALSFAVHKVNIDKMEKAPRRE